MKRIFLLMFFVAASLVHAATPEGDIYALDPKAGTIVLSTPGGLQTYRIRPDSEITLNGVRSKVTDLSTTMTAKVITSQPGVATKVIANGVAAPIPGVPRTGNAPNQQLPRSQWRFTDGKVFTLHSDGTTTGSWHERKGTWQIIAPNTIELRINWKEGPLERVSLNPDGTIMTWTARDDKGQHKVAKKLRE